MKALRGFVGSRPSTSSGSQPSTSAVFPTLRKLDLPTDEPNESPLLTLTLSAPSFLDAVVKDEFSDGPLYIVETHRDRTGIYRCETENITSVAKVQWPSRSKMISASAVALSGVSVQMHGGRWRPAEEFLKFGSLFASRKFRVPHHPHSLKWKRVGGSYTCTCSSIKGPLAILQAAYLSAPPRLRVYSSLTRDDGADRNQPNYGGVPHVLLDYLVATSLILVTDIEEYLHRPGKDVGEARSAMEAFLPPSLRKKRNGRGSSASTESRSPANSTENISISHTNSHLTDDARSITSEMPSTPTSTISQYHPYSCFYIAAPDPDVPPVPEVPPEHQSSVAPVPPTPPRSSTLPPPQTVGRTPTFRRRLPQPPGPVTPITPSRTEHLWGLSRACSTPDLTLPSDSPDSSISIPPVPAHQQHQRQTSELSRPLMAINRRQLPPQRQPPQLPMPLPPKLIDDLTRSIPPSAASSDGVLSSTSDAPGDTGQPGSSIRGGGDSAGAVGSGQSQEFHRRFSDTDNPPLMRASVYDLPPPAYDAIDFSIPRPPALGGEGYQSFSVNSRLPPEQIS